MQKMFLIISLLVFSVIIAAPLGATDTKKGWPPLDGLLQEILAWILPILTCQLESHRPQSSFFPRSSSRRSVTTVLLLAKIEFCSHQYVPWARAKCRRTL